MSMHVFRKKRLGFNAIELVVVVLVVAIAMGLILVVLQSRPRNWYHEGRTGTNDNLKQLALACHSVNDVHKKLPPAFDQFEQMTFPASIHVHLLPYLEQDRLYQTFLAAGGNKGNSEIVPPFISPVDTTVTNDGAGVQNFAANLRVFSGKGVRTPFDGNMAPLAGIEPGTSSIPKTFQDGTSNTIVFATKLARCGNGGSRYAASPISPFAAFFGQNAARERPHPSAKTAAYQLNPSLCLTSPLMAQSFDQRGISVALADGSVRCVHPDISPRTWNQALQPNDGMILGDQDHDW